jgi:hypothetical protein
MVSVELRARVGSGYVVIALRGDLDTADAQSPGSAVSELAEGGQLLIIDLDALEYGLVLLPLVGAPGAAAALQAPAAGIPGRLASRP